MNYTPSLLARSLRIKKTNTIGLIVPSIENPFFANIISVIVKEAKNKGYTIIIADTSEDDKIENEYIDSLVSRNIDGLIMVPCGNSQDKLQHLYNEIPIVLIDRYFLETPLPYVSTDNYLGAYLATKHLINNGHKNIHCIQGTPTSTPVIKRIEGYKKCMKENGLVDNISIGGDNFSVENGYAEMRKMFLKTTEPPTAVFALSNTIALGAYKAIKEFGYSIPNDISIICFDSHPYLDYIDPPLTRIVQPIDEIALLSTTIIIDKLENKDENTKLQDSDQILLKPSITIGRSVLNIQ